MASKRNSFLIDIVDPRTGTTGTVIVPDYLIQQAQKRSDMATFHDARTLGETLKGEHGPVRVFEGTRAQGALVNGLCFIAQPAYRYDSEGRLGRTVEDDFFQIYTDPDLVAYDWRWDAYSYEQGFKTLDDFCAARLAKEITPDGYHPNPQHR